MAIRWTVGEAFVALKSGDKEAREDIGRRFPLFATATPEELLGAIHNMTARQVEARLRGDEDDEDEQPVKAKSVDKDKDAKMKKDKKENKKASKRPKVVQDDDEDDDFLDDFLDEDDEE